LTRHDDGVGVDDGDDDSDDDSDPGTNVLISKIFFAKFCEKIVSFLL
jgi:hypothetical protein